MIAGYRLATGDAPLFPKAAYGFWQCRERYSSQDANAGCGAVNFASKQHSRGFHRSGLAILGHHGWGAYEWDLKNYPDPDQHDRRAAHRIILNT